MRRKSRLFALAEYLRGRRTGITAEQLAERFGVTVRTIYRDLDALREASLPVLAERGPGGGYALDRAYTLPPVNFTPREAAVLVVLGRFATETRLVPFVDTLESALSKVRGALSAGQQREALAHAEKLAFAAVPALPARPAVRRVVEEAWFGQRVVRLRWHSREGACSEGTVRISRVLMERTMTVLECLDAQTGEARGIRLDRIDDASLVEP
ncbi:MAG TPA: HTH domain-containing protein [Polyangiaceae bacterium]|nr:HTH domain-containing protein [Polyangiaceae bacterium]